MSFADEPTAGENLPILPGHFSPGRFERVLRAGQFAVTAEIAPPDSADPNEVYARAEDFNGYVDAINATDGSGANCHMSSMGICALLTRMGYSMILQMSCRDRNRISMQGDVLGAAAMGVANILCLSGDGVQSGDHPEAKPVFDMDSISALSMVRHMRDNSAFLSGRSLSSPPRLFMGGASNPFAPPLDFRPNGSPKKSPREPSSCRPSTASILNASSYLWPKPVTWAFTKKCLFSLAWALWLQQSQPTGSVKMSLEYTFLIP